MLYAGPLLAEIPTTGCLILPRWGATVCRAGNLAVVHYVAQLQLPPSIVGPGDVIGCYYVVWSQGVLGLVMTSLCAGSSTCALPKVTAARILLADNILACYRLCEQSGATAERLLDILSLNEDEKTAVETFQTVPIDNAKLNAPLGGGGAVVKLARSRVDWVWSKGVFVGSVGATPFVPPLHRAASRQLLVHSGVVSAGPKTRLYIGNNAKLQVRIQEGVHFWTEALERAPQVRERLIPPQKTVGPPSVLAQSPESIHLSVLDPEMYAQVKLGIDRKLEQRLPFKGFAAKAVPKLRAWNDSDKAKVARCELAQIKYDGLKVFLHVKDGVARLFTKKGLEFTDHERFNFAAMPNFSLKRGVLYAGLPDCILDGEYIRVEEFKDGQPVRIKHNASSTRGAGYYVVYDLAYLSNEDMNTTPYRRRLSLLGPLTQGFPSVLVAKSYELDEDRVASAVTLLDRICAGEAQEGIIVKTNDSGYRRRQQFALKPVYVHARPIVVQFMGSYRSSKRTSNGFRQDDRYVFGVPDHRSVWKTGHPWAGYVPVFTYTAFGSSTGLTALVAKSCLETATVSTIPNSLKEGPIGLVTALANPSASAPRYMFKPEAFLAFETNRARRAWAPMTAYPHIPAGGSVAARTVPLSTVDEMNARAIR